MIFRNGLFVLIGIPGSGKSHWLKLNRSSFPHSYVVCPDTIRKKFFNDISDQNSNAAVWDIAKEQVIAALKCDHDVILDATNVNTSYRQEFLSDIIPFYDVTAIVFDITPEEAYQRIARDIKNGIDRSNVPKHVIYRMYEEYLYTLIVLETEGFKSIINSDKI